MNFDLTAKRFHDEDAAREYLETIRWPNGPICPHCGCIGRTSRLEGKSHRKGLLFCGDCREQFSVTVGTIFHGSKIKLHKWVLACHLLCASKKGMSSLQLKRMLGVTYKSAWFMTHRIREAMKPNGGGLMGSGGGVVEADETYWGNQGKQKKGGRGYQHKMKIVSLVERGGEKRSIVVSNVNAKTLRVVIDGNIDKSAHLMTDEHYAYTKIGREFASHGVTKHVAGEYARGEIHSNTVESSFSLLKRGLIGTFHHVGEQHLQRYVNEFDFRWNHRKIDDVSRAETLLSQIGGKRLTYVRSDRLQDQTEK
jgi:transposase-like protein